MQCNLSDLAPETIPGLRVWPKGQLCPQQVQLATAGYNGIISYHIKMKSKLKKKKKKLIVKAIK